MSAGAVHRIGFTQLSRNRDAATEPAKVNIVFVHGLSGHPKETWEGDRVEEHESRPTRPRKRDRLRLPFRQKSTASPSRTATDDTSGRDGAIERKIFWPQEFLVPDTPEATIWTYGYNANVIEGMFQAGNKNSVYQHAQDLMVQIQRDIEDERPIIFVAHSLGGIVVKRAFSRSEALRARTKFIIFLGTPHRGSGLADWGKRLARSTSQDFNRGLLETLKINNLVLDDIQTTFQELVQNVDIKIHSFQEGRGGVMGLRSKVVDDFSSKLELVGIETVETIDADHRQMAKCSSRSDPQYRAISGVLRQFIRSLPTAARDTGTSRGGSATPVDGPATIPQPEPPLLVTPQPRSLFLVPYARNEAFIGRQSILETLKQQRLDGNYQVRMALYGLGGIGKTQIALEYVYWLREVNPEISIFWVNASKAEHFREAFTSLSRECRIPGHDDPKADVISGLKRRLEREENGRWLMVLDNADDMKLFYSSQSKDGVSSAEASSTSNRRTNFAQYIPDCAHGAVLVTTRDKQTGMRLTKGKRLIEVGNMDEKEAEDLLRETLQEEEAVDLDSNDLATLSSRLEYLPLALVQAASFIRENCTTITHYLELLDKSDQHFVELLSEEFKTVGRDSLTSHAITSTWILSFEQVQRQNELAADLLSLMSFFDRQAIPMELLTIYNERFSDRKTKNEVQFTKALGTLKAFSFMTEDKEHKFNFHRLIQMVTRKWLAIKEMTTKFAEMALRTLHVAFPGDGKDPKTWGACHSYLAHAASAVDATIEPDMFESEDVLKVWATLVSNVAGYFYATGEASMAECLYVPALNIRRHVEGQRSPVTASTIVCLARTYRDMGQHAKAESLQREWLEEIADVVEEEHPGDIFKKSEIMGSYYKQTAWCFEEFDAYQAETWEAGKHVTTNDLIVTLEFIQCLSVTCGLQGRLKEAQTLGGYVLGIRKRLLGDQHIDVVDAMNSLAEINSDFGDFRHNADQRAMELDAKILEASRRIRGEDHPETLLIISRIARRHCKLQHFSEAEAQQVQVLEASRRVFGEEHARTMEASRDLATTYWQQGRHKEAKTRLSSTLKHARWALGDEHPFTISILQQLGYLNGAKGLYGEADVYFTRVRDVASKIFGRKHRYTLRCERDLAWNQHMNKKSEDATRNLESVVRELGSSFGDYHPDTIMVRGCLAQIYFSINSFDGARKHYEDLWERHRILLGEEHFTTMAHLYSFSRSCFEVEEYSKAEELFRRVWDAARRAGDDDNCAFTMLWVARCCIELSRGDDAERFLRRVLSSPASVRHSHLQRETKFWLAKVLESKDDLRGADRLYSEVWEFVKATSQDSPDYEEMMWTIAHYRYRMNRLREAIDIMQTLGDFQSTVAREFFRQHDYPTAWYYNSMKWKTGDRVDWKEHLRRASGLRLCNWRDITSWDKFRPMYLGFNCPRWPPRNGPLPLPIPLSWRAEGEALKAEFLRNRGWWG